MPRETTAIRLMEEIGEEGDLRTVSGAPATFASQADVDRWLKSSDITDRSFVLIRVIGERHINTHTVRTITR